MLDIHSLPKMISWVKVAKGIQFTFTPTTTITFTPENGNVIAFRQGEQITAVYVGYRQEENRFLTMVNVSGYDCTFCIFPKDITVEAMEAGYCLRCSEFLPEQEFQRHPSTRDKSPILSEVCERCYRNIKGKITSYNSMARANGGKVGLKVSEWLEKLKASEGHCCYCHACIGRDKLIMEHRNPLSLGGDNTRENVFPACYPCNSSKSGRDYEAWQQSLEMRRLIIQLQEHFGLDRQGVANLALKTLAQKVGLSGESEGKP